MSRIDAVIFDLDGTLADSLGDIAEAMNEVLQGLGLKSHPWEAYKHFVGEGAEVLVQRAVRAAAGADVSPALLTDLVDRYRIAYGKLDHAYSKPYPGVSQLLDAVVAARKPMAVLSNKRDDFSKHLVKRLFGKWPWVEVRGERAGVPRKPNPRAALEIAEVFGLAPQRVAFVGDTAIDMQTAVAAGMWPIGVLWGFRSREELESAGAREVATQPHELARRLLEAPIE